MRLLDGGSKRKSVRTPDVTGAKFVDEAVVTTVIAHTCAYAYISTSYCTCHATCQYVATTRRIHVPVYSVFLFVIAPAGTIDRMAVDESDTIDRD